MLAFIGMPGPTEMVIIGIIAVLLFGNRLPAVARSIGGAIPSFKKGMAEVENECKEIEKEINK
jgi:sec-independent protein translocase protein TatA